MRNFYTALKTHSTPLFLVGFFLLDIDGLGEMLAGSIVEGSIKVGDRLVLNDVKIPILEIRQIDFTTPIVMITISRKLDASGPSDLRPFELFGTTVPVEGD